MTKNYRRLKCGPTSKQCGGTCISKEETCHKGKANLLQANVKKEISRLEQGKEPGAITNKAFAKLLVTDPDIGQKLPKELSPYMASSDKIDDKVKKAYFDSATRKSWNIDSSHGSRPAIKLKKQDEAFARKLNNRSKQYNSEAKNGDEKEFEQKSQNFFKTDKGKNVLKIIAATATIGAAAAITTYAVKQGQSRVKSSKDDNQTSVQEVVTRSYQQSPEKVQAREDIREAMRQAGDTVSSNQIGDANYTTATPAETYANMYDRAKYLDKQVESGVSLSTRESTDYRDSWGFEPGTRKGKEAKSDSKLGKAKAEAVEYIKKEAPNATDSDISQGIDYLKGKKNYDAINRGENMQYDPNSKTWSPRTYVSDINQIKNPETGIYEDAPNLNFDKSDHGNIEKRIKERGRADRLRAEENSAQGSSFEQDRFQASSTKGKRESSEGINIDSLSKEVTQQIDVDALKKEGIFSGIKDERQTTKMESGFSQLSNDEANRQRKAWDELDDSTKNDLYDSEVLRDLKGGQNYAGDLVDGASNPKKTAKKYVQDKLLEVYDRGTLGVLRDQKKGQIKTALETGLPVLPAFKSQAGSIESDIDLGPSKAGKVSDGISISDNLSDNNVIGTDRGGNLTAKQRKQNDLAAIQPSIFEDTGEKYTKKTLANGAELIIDAKGKRFKRKGNYLYIDNVKVTGDDMQEKLRKAWKVFNFSEIDEDLLVRDILEIRDNVMVVDSNEGILSLIFDANNDVTIVAL